MAVIRTNQAWRAGGVVAVLVFCGFVAVGVARWPDIQFELGYAYEYGNFHGWTFGFAQDYGRAAHWLGEASRANHPRAQYMLGLLYAHGWGVPRDGIRAVEWFTRSAENGYAPACYHLGWMYHKGDGVPREEARAMRLMERAASQGMAAAHLALGRFYARGEGMSADAVQALKYFDLAVHFARSRPELFDNAAFAGRAIAARDALVAVMSPSGIEQGQTRSRQWLSERFPIRTGNHAG